MMPVNLNTSKCKEINKNKIEIVTHRWLAYDNAISSGKPFLILLTKSASSSETF